MQASSLRRHLADLHEIYQQQVVAKELFEEREGVTYKVALGCRKLRCPFPLCKGELASGWMMRRHFRDLCFLDYVVVAKEGRYPRCLHCGMQTDLRFPTHINTKECQVGTERQHQQDMAVQSALALRQQFTVHGDVLEQVKVFRYLGRLHPSRAESASKGTHDLGKGRTSATKGELASSVERQILQGHCAICPPVRKQDVGPEPSCHSQTQRIPHPHRIQDGKGTHATPRDELPMDIPILQ